MIEVIQGVVPANIIDRWNQEKKLIQDFERTTGILKTRKTDRSATALATTAARKALEHSNPSQIAALIVVTQSPDRQSPPMAVELLEKVPGLNKSILAFDINQACCGYVYGLHVANSLLLATGDMTAKALVVTVDKLKLESSETEKLIFSDAATATILSFDSKMEARFFNDPTGQPYLNMKDGLMHMNGNRVFEYVIDNVPHMIATMPNANFIVQHQANLMMMEMVQKRARNSGQLKDCVNLASINEYGNTSLNSVPLTIAHNAHRFEEKDQSILMCGYGAGWSAALLHTTIPTTARLKVDQI